MGQQRADSICIYPQNQYESIKSFGRVDPTANTKIAKKNLELMNDYERYFHSIQSFVYQVYCRNLTDDICQALSLVVHVLSKQYFGS